MLFWEVAIDSFSPIEGLVYLHLIVSSFPNRPCHKSIDLGFCFEILPLILILEISSLASKFNRSKQILIPNLIQFLNRNQFLQKLQLDQKCNQNSMFTIFMKSCFKMHTSIAEHIKTV